MFHFCAQTIQMDCSTVNANAHSMIYLLHGIHAKIEAYYKVIIYHKSYIPHTDHFLLYISELKHSYYGSQLVSILRQVNTIR